MCQNMQSGSVSVEGFYENMSPKWPHKALECHV